MKKYKEYTLAIEYNDPKKWSEIIPEVYCDDFPRQEETISYENKDFVVEEVRRSIMHSKKETS